MNDYDVYLSKLKNIEGRVDFDKMLAKIRYKSEVVPRQRMALATTLMVLIFGFATYFIQIQISVDNDLVMSYVFDSPQSSDEWNLYSF